MRLFLLAVCLWWNSTSWAANDVDAFYARLGAVLSKHYPQGAISTAEERWRFDANTRLFMIHEPLKTGEWQDAREQRGPKRGGIYCEIVSESGPYLGAAVVPQTFDKRYFTVLLLAPYSKRLDRHLHVLLSYPGDATKDFLREFTEAVNRFEGY